MTVNKIIANKVTVVNMFVDKITTVNKISENKMTKQNDK